MSTLKEQIDSLDTAETSDKSTLQKTLELQAYPAMYANEVCKQVFLGVADLLGLPKVGADFLRGQLGYEKESGLPSRNDIQKFMADFGITYQPGEEPDDIAARFWRNIGASGPFLLKGAGKSVVTETLSALGGAAGGKGLEATTWGEQHPHLARAVGELGGGLALSSATLLKNVPTLGPIGAMLRKPFKGDWAKRRAAQRAGDLMTDREIMPKRFERTRNIPEFEGLTPTQKTGGRGLATLRKTVEKELPEEAEAGVRQRSIMSRELERRAVQPSAPNIRNVRKYLDAKFKQLAEEADDAMGNIKAGDEAALSKVAETHARKAYRMARNEESRVWGNLPSTNPKPMPNTAAVFKKEFQNITEGGDLEDIDTFIREKLGRINEKGKLVGGKLLNAKKTTATPKAMHQFYSKLGSRMAEVSVSPGQANKMRILSDIRDAVLEDLKATGAGPDYEEAIRFSEELNEMFTKGALGKVLGFQRGNATEASMFLDKLLGSGGEEAVLGLRQLLKASPDAESSIVDLIKTRFALTAVGKNNRINRKAAERFMGKYRRVLNVFPDLKSELTVAAQKQSKLDDLVGATDLSDVSPLIRQRTAAATFLGADPGDEMAKLLKTARSGGKTTRYLREMVDECKKDPTGKASLGLKNGLIGELLEESRSKASAMEDPLTGLHMVSGRAFLEKLNRLSGSLIKSGAMTEKEVSRLRRIGTAFKNIETEMRAGAREKLIVDKPGIILETVARLFGARWGAKLGGVSPGGQIQSAGIGAGLSKWIANHITKDEAKILLVQATRDDEIYADLLKDVSRLSKEEQMGLAKRLVSRAKRLVGRTKTRIEQAQAPITAVVPPAVHAPYSTERESGVGSLKEQIRLLQ